MQDSIIRCIFATTNINLYDENHYYHIAHLCSAYNENDKPIADAWIHVEGKSQMGSGTASDSTGHFAFWLPRTWLTHSDATLTASKDMNWVTKIPITDTPITIRLIPFVKRKKK